MIYKNRYTITEIEEITTWHDNEDPDGYETEYGTSREVPSDIQDVIKALESDHWDNLDIRSDELLAYPADGSINFRTGAETRTTLVIKGNEYDMLCMLNYYFRKVHKGTRRYTSGFHSAE